MNQNDWNDGYSYAENGLEYFATQMSDDNEIDTPIYNQISDIVNDTDFIDGRCFRDCTYNYDYLFGLVPADLYADYEKLKYAKEQLSPSW